MDDGVLKGNGERLLVVDDEATIREVITMTLELNGYECRTAENGSDAYALYLQEREQIAAVITDLHMERGDGVTLVRWLRLVSPGVKVIVSSGYICAEKKQTLEALGVKGLLAKPYSSEALLRCVRDTLDDRLAVHPSVR
jgi:two-component system, cell cycle sensor histidine kinase and response regulator CckA